MLYLAYGSNLNKNQMSHRCPLAIPAGTALLKGYKLQFKRVAHIEETAIQDDIIPCGLWEITSKCEKSLDVYEGYPNLYGKKQIKLDDQRMAMTYFMINGEIEKPSENYFETILEGYKDFDLPVNHLRQVLKVTAIRTQN